VHDAGVAPPESLTRALRATLAAVGAARGRGALQADVGKALGIAPNNFFYQVSRLEARGLLRRAAVSFRNADNRAVRAAKNALFLA
jgi:DNA-binding MarR family transcriptional regulator